jgi:hypothetical protein
MLPLPPRQKAFITLGSRVVPLHSTSKADSGLASEFRWDRAIYTAYERMLKAHTRTSTYHHNIQPTNNQKYSSCTNTRLPVDMQLHCALSPHELLCVTHPLWLHRATMLSSRLDQLIREFISIQLNK